MTTAHAKAMAIEMIDAAETYLTVNAIPLSPEASGTIVKEAIAELIRAMSDYDKHFVWRAFAEIRKDQREESVG